MLSSDEIDYRSPVHTTVMQLNGSGLIGLFSSTVNYTQGAPHGNLVAVTLNQHNPRSLDITT